MRFRVVTALVLLLGSAVQADERPVTAVRRGSWAVMGAAVISTAVGGYFAISSSLARSAVRSDAAAGIFSQEQLDIRDFGAIRQGRVGNGLFITAAVFAIAGLVMFLLG